MYTEEKYNDIDKLIASYLSNELDEKSFSELKRWSMESETNRIYVRDQLEIWFSSGVLSDKTFFNKNEAFDLFKQRVAEAGRNKRLRRFSWNISRSRCSFTFVVAFGYLLARKGGCQT